MRRPRPPRMQWPAVQATCPEPSRLCGQVFNTRQVACWQLEVASGRPCIVCVVVERSGAPPRAAPGALLQEDRLRSPAPRGGELKPLAGPLRSAGSSASSQLLGSRASELSTRTSLGGGTPHAAGRQSGLPLHGKLAPGGGAPAAGPGSPSAGVPAQESAPPGGLASAGELDGKRPPGDPSALVDGQPCPTRLPPAQGAGPAGVAGGHAEGHATGGGQEPADVPFGAGEACGRGAGGDTPGSALAAPGGFPASDEQAGLTDGP